MEALFIDPFEMSFMQRALIGVIVLGICGPVCGLWVVHRRIAYLADALSHSLLPGLVVATALGASLLTGAFGAAIVIALTVAFFVSRSHVGEDSAIGVVSQTMLALGVLGIAAQRDATGLLHVLFGNPLTATWSDVAMEVALAAIIVVGTWFLYPYLLSTTFDAQHARTTGVRVGLIDAVLVVGVSLVVVVGLTTVGTLMAVVMVIFPATAARMITMTVRSAMAVSIVLGVFAGVTGLLVSYHMGLTSGPVIAVVAAIEVLVSAVVAEFGRRRSPHRMPETPSIAHQRATSVVSTTE